MKGFNKLTLTAGGIFVWLLLQGPLKPYLKAITNSKAPQVILVLGGDVDREHVGVKMAKDLQLPLIISGGSNPEHANWITTNAGLSLNLLKLDYRAKDTLGNFTSLVDDFSSQGINHALLITSEDHLPRAIAVGLVIAGSRGVKLTSVSVSCSPNCEKESLQKQLIDVIRAVAWVITEKDLKLVTKQKLQKSLHESMKVIFPTQRINLDPAMN